MVTDRALAIRRALRSISDGRLASGASLMDWEFNDRVDSPRGLGASARTALAARGMLEQTHIDVAAVLGRLARGELDEPAHGRSGSRRKK
jgi:hypothetical protein